jgi:uridylate kinase
MTSTPEPRFKRILLKLSGEALKGEKDYGHDAAVIRTICEEIKSVVELGVQVGIVVGGGNIFRGASEAAAWMNRTVADQIGMLGTLINSLTLQAALEDVGVDTRVMSAIEVSAIAEVYIRRRAIRHLEKDRVVIFACGTGHPFFSTDTAGALRGKEIDAEVLLKATNVDGVYDSDPRKNPDAKRLDDISFTRVLRDDLKVMDATAFALCRDNKLPIIVFDLNEKGNVRRVVLGEDVGTHISAAS